MKRYLIPLAIPLILSASDSMEAIYLKNGCQGCHGMYGEGIGASPRLQGVREEVLLQRLKNLKQGKTRTAFGNIMVSFARNLSDEEIVKMAKYLSSLKRVEKEETYELEYDNTGDGSS